jgi:hypothetical protein
MQVVRALWEQKPSQLFPDVRCATLFAAAETKGTEGQAKTWMQMKHEAIERAKGLLQNCQVKWFEDTIHDIPLHRPRALADTIRDFALELE